EEMGLPLRVRAERVNFDAASQAALGDQQRVSVARSAERNGRVNAGIDDPPGLILFDVLGGSANAFVVFLVPHDRNGSPADQIEKFAGPCPVVRRRGQQASELFIER